MMSQNTNIVINFEDPQCNLVKNGEDQSHNDNFLNYDDDYWLIMIMILHGDNFVNDDALDDDPTQVLSSHTCTGTSSR